MPYELDPDLLQTVASGPPMASMAPAPRGDHLTLRSNAEAGLAAMDARLPELADDLTSTAVFFAADEARFVTGQVLVVDGGKYMPA